MTSFVTFNYFYCEFIDVDEYFGHNMNILNRFHKLFVFAKIFDNKVRNSCVSVVVALGNPPPIFIRLNYYFYTQIIFFAWLFYFSVRSLYFSKVK